MYRNWVVTLSSFVGRKLSGPLIENCQPIALILDVVIILSSCLYFQITMFHNGIVIYPIDKRSIYLARATDLKMVCLSLPVAWHLISHNLWMCLNSIHAVVENDGCCKCTIKVEKVFHGIFEWHCESNGQCLMIWNNSQYTVKPLIHGAPNNKTSSCGCLCPIHSSQVLSREWRCSCSSAYIWVINTFVAN